MNFKQAILDIALDIDADSVVLTACNEAIIAQLMAPENWTSHACYLSGPAKSGKSTLKQEWMRAGDDRVTFELSELGEALDGQQEEALFHLFNSTKQEGKKLLVVGDRAIEQCNIKLADLSSRLKASDQLALPQPDDELAIMLCTKLFALRQLQVDDDVMEYCLKRIPRSYAAIQKLVDTLDKHALEEHRNITIPLAKTVIELTSWE